MINISEIHGLPLVNILKLKSQKDFSKFVFVLISVITEIAV